MNILISFRKRCKLRINIFLFTLLSANVLPDELKEKGSFKGDKERKRERVPEGINSDYQFQWEDRWE